MLTESPMTQSQATVTAFVVRFCGTQATAMRTLMTRPGRVAAFLASNKMRAANQKGRHPSPAFFLTTDH
jgi:hypothetical protein